MKKLANQDFLENNHLLNQADRISFRGYTLKQIQHGQRIVVVNNYYIENSNAHLFDNFL